MTKSQKNQDELAEKDTAKRRDEIAKRMLDTPPKPRKVSKPKKNSKS